MKANSILVAIVIVTSFGAGCSKPAAAPDDEKKAVAAEPPVQRSTNGEIVIKLDGETQKRMGLETTRLTATPLKPELKTGGRVLDPAGISSVVADFLSARATAEVSASELERARTLAKSENVSTRALQTAEAGAEREAAQLETTRAKLIGALGREVASLDNLADWVKPLTTGASALVRLDLLPGETATPPLAGARVVALGEGRSPVEGKFVGATTVDATSQARGLLFLVAPNLGALMAGEAVTGFIKVAGTTQAGVEIPRSAVLRKDGATWVYVQTGEDNFTRREISADRPGVEGWFVTHGVAPGDKVVTVGAQQLLSEEVKGQIGGD